MTGTSAGSARTLAGPRHERFRLGVVLAFVALLAQIAGAGLHPLFPIRLADGGVKFAIDLDAHALCLAHDSTASGPPAPADKAPKADHDFAACCVWHAAAGVVLAPAAVVEQVAFDASRVVFAAPAEDIPTRLASPVRARAPPAEA